MKGEQQLTIHREKRPVLSQTRLVRSSFVAGSLGRRGWRRAVQAAREDGTARVLAINAR